MKIRVKWNERESTIAKASGTKWDTKNTTKSISVQSIYFVIRSNVSKHKTNSNWRVAHKWYKNARIEIRFFFFASQLEISLFKRHADYGTEKATEHQNAQNDIKQKERFFPFLCTLTTNNHEEIVVFFSVTNVLNCIKCNHCTNCKAIALATIENALHFH